MNILKKISIIQLCVFVGVQLFAQDKFPDGSLIPNWFRQSEIVDIQSLGKVYRITDYGVLNDSTILQTQKIQAVIDIASVNGGGVIYVPEGVYHSGALFFKPKTHLYLEKDAVIKGSDDISNFPIIPTRIEGRSIDYFAALINADGVDGFTISGEGTINGNGHRYWRSFWLRRRINPKCTNIEELRPRLVHVSNSKDVQISGIRLVNSPFWTTHIYKCERVKLLNLYIFSPAEPVKAPSADAIDIDVCTDVLVKNCYLSVNDDAIALKGGKGPLADKDENNGGNKNIIIEDCVFGFCHSSLTCGSESIHNHNIILRRCDINKAKRLLWLKMRPDTPQNYEYILVENIKGTVSSFLYVKPWTQFFDLQGQTVPPMSYAQHVIMRNIQLECEIMFDVRKSDQYELSNFIFQDLDILATKNSDLHKDYFKDLKLDNVVVNGIKLK